MRSWRGVSGAVVLVVALVACGDEPGWDSVVEPSQLEYYGTTAPISAPATARAGEPVVVRVDTLGGDCTDFESTEVTGSATAADVRPLDRRLIPSGNGGCTLILEMITHEATLTFDTPGTKTVTVHGRRVDSRGDEPFATSLLIVVE